MENHKILIAEDDIILGKMYKTKLEKEGFSVRLLSDGFQLIVELQKEKPDIILLDIMMPEMNGIDTLRIIKNQTSIDLKNIIIFSNLNQDSFKEEAFRLGAGDYIVKSDVTPGELVQKIKNKLL